MSIPWERMSSGVEAQVGDVMLFDRKDRVEGQTQFPVHCDGDEVWFEISADFEYAEGKRDEVAERLVKALEAQRAKALS